MRRGKRMNLGHVGGERGRDNRTQGRGRKPRETSATRAGRPVEKPVSRRERKSGDEIPEADAASEREIYPVGK